MADDDGLDRKARLDELDRCDLMDTQPEEAFDRITRLVCRVFGVGMSTVTLIDGHRQWFKSFQGVASRETAREPSFCRLPIGENRPLVVPDTLDDDRFRDNPFVVGSPHLRFYAGVPIRSGAGVPIGTLCAMDDAPRAFGATDLGLLADLGRLVETELDLRSQAAIDAVTRALPRLAFREAADRDLASASIRRHDFSLVVFDIDHFEAIEDEDRDDVLRHVAQTVRDQLRKTDVLGRRGDAAFAAVFTHTSAADAVTIADKMRAAIKDRPLVLPDRTLAVTASFGIAWLDQPDVDIDLLLDRATSAMDQAKGGGGDRAILWHGPSETTLSRRVLKAGQIVFNGGRSVIDCTVRRMSEVGGRIDVIAPEGVPRRFKLSIPADAFSRACTIVEQRHKQLDVVFEQAL